MSGITWAWKHHRYFEWTWIRRKGNICMSSWIQCSWCEYMKQNRRQRDILATNYIAEFFSLAHSSPHDCVGMVTGQAPHQFARQTVTFALVLLHYFIWAQFFHQISRFWNITVYCLTPPVIEHARHSALPEQGTFELDSTVQYHCHSGYVTAGFPRAKCLAIDGHASWYVDFSYFIDFRRLL